MALSKKHYEQFAERFQQQLVAIGVDFAQGAFSAEALLTANKYLFELAERMSIDFALDNSNFNKARFLRACGF